ncbi:hypothetical protein V8C35DRAFT_313976 [Trichoderma chlorosporum]
MPGRKLQGLRAAEGLLALALAPAVHAGTLLWTAGRVPGCESGRLSRNATQGNATQLDGGRRSLMPRYQIPGCNQAAEVEVPTCTR